MAADALASPGGATGVTEASEALAIPQCRNLGAGIAERVGGSLAQRDISCALGCAPWPRRDGTPDAACLLQGRMQRGFCRQRAWGGSEDCPTPRASDRAAAG